MTPLQPTSSAPPTLAEVVSLRPNAGDPTDWLAAPPRPPRAAGQPLLRTPQSIEECGLSQVFLVELVAKTMFQRGTSRLTELGQQLCLSGGVVEALCKFMRQEGLIEIGRRGTNDADVEFDLTIAGRLRASEWLARNQYVGPAPVPLDVYCERVRAQSVHRQRITQPQVHEAFADLVMPAGLQDELGTALNAGKPMLLYGEAGAGKTYVAEHLHRLLPGTVAIPHAIYVHGEVVRVFDPHWHTPVQPPAGAPLSGIDNRARADARWVMCKRPRVSAGGELTLEMLDLSFDARAGFYEAPLHFKANNGLFIVDDLGRQIVKPGELMNRWIVPMKHRFDHLMLRNGGKFEIPFDLVLVFLSDLHPSELEDAAFLRRLGQKIRVGELSPGDYLTLLDRACERAGMPCDAAAAQWLVGDLHAREGKPLLACYPNDLVQLIASRAAYFEIAPALLPELVEWAWHCQFNDAESANGPRMRVAPRDECPAHLSHTPPENAL